MQRHELEELHYITPLANMPSILNHGILSHVRVKRITHESVAMDEIQDRRAKVIVPSGRKLHEYVNLYLCARNPMMYKRQNTHQDLCVLRIRPNIIDLSGVVVTDGNASGDYVRFSAAPRGLAIVNREWTFADDWTDPDPIQYYRKKAAKCAEVLVPDRVDLHYITGAYVSCQEAMNKLQSLNTHLPVAINNRLFFR
jgi:hypothetical protein